MTLLSQTQDIQIRRDGVHFQRWLVQNMYTSITYASSLKRFICQLRPLNISRTIAKKLRQFQLLRLICWTAKQTELITTAQERQSSAEMIAISHTTLPSSNLIKCNQENKSWNEALLWLDLILKKIKKKVKMFIDDTPSTHLKSSFLLRIEAFSLTITVNSFYKILWHF